jgi:nitrate reductase cytochrome c-type subunit
MEAAIASVASESRATSVAHPRSQDSSVVVVGSLRLGFCVACHVVGSRAKSAVVVDVVVAAADGDYACFC